jgi:hypothetical protein
VAGELMPYARICFEDNRYLLREVVSPGDENSDMRYIPQDVMLAYEAHRAQGEVFQALFGAWDRASSRNRPTIRKVGVVDF